MTISKIVPIELISSSGVIETAGVYDSSMRKFTLDQELINKDGDTRVFKRVGDTFTVLDYDEDKTDYKMYDLAWKDNKTQYVYNTSGIEIKQPEEYDDSDTSLNPDDWGYRYLNLGQLETRDDGSSSYSFSVDIVNTSDDYHTLFVLRYTNDDNTDMIFINGRLLKDTTQYGDDNNYIDVSDATFHWGDDSYCLGLLQDTDSLSTGDKFYIPCTNADVQTNLTHKDYGYVLEVGDQIDGSKYKFYVWVVRDEDTSTKNYYYVSGDGYKKIKFVDTGDELTAVGEDSTYYLWYPRVLIERDDTIYTRTNINADIEYKEVDEFSFKELESVDEIPWDWVDYRPTAEYAPFDSKKYTFVESNTDIVYKVKGDGFDVVALNGLVASNIKVKVYNDNEDIVDNIDVYPKCVSNLSGKSKTSTGISVIYLSDMYDDTYTVEITLHPLDGVARLGGCYLGNKSVVGFTNLAFGNGFRNFNYFSQDQFGDIVATNNAGAKIRTFSGTADILLAEYDDATLVLQDILDDKVIVDGSDNEDNEHPDSLNYFLGSMIVGRVREIKQNTRTTNDRLDEMATYSFKVEEDI